MKKQHTLLFGAHMSIAGGIDKALDRGESIGCTAIQIFTKSNRQWHAKPLDAQEIALFKEKRKKSSIKSVIAHATYLINLGTSDKLLEKKSIDAVLIELKRCGDLEIPYLVLHPGSRGNTDEESCLERISDNLNKIFTETSEKTDILLETMAGQGNSVCYTFEQIAEIIKNSRFKKRLGVCFDTCHAFVAGYDFGTEATYKKMWKNFDSIIGLNKLKAMHINDSKQSLGSRVDRHADIGKGKIDLNAFRMIFNDQRFATIPKILETPKTDLKEDLKNMETIFALIKK